MSDGGKKRRRLRMAIRIALIVGGLGGYGLFGVRPKLVALADLDKRIASKETQAEKRRAEFSRVRKFHDEEEEEVRKRETALRATFPLRDAAGVSDILDGAARETGLSLADCRVLDPILHLDTAPSGSGDKHFRVPIEATLTGRYRSLPDFLAKIAANPRALRVEGIGVERDAATFPSVKIRLALRSFFLEPTPAETAAAPAPASSAAAPPDGGGG